MKQYIPFFDMKTMLKAQRNSELGMGSKMFDWDKAAEIIKYKKPKVAEAGLIEDWGYTGGEIYMDGEIIEGNPSCIYLSSNWATPTLILDGEEIPCWKEGNISDEYWPESARKILVV